MHRRDIMNAGLLLAVFALSLFIYLGGVKEEADTGLVLGESTAAQTDGAQLGLFVEGLLSKRRAFGAADCDFLVAEDSASGPSSWEGELIWSDGKNYKLSRGEGQEAVLVSRGSVFAVGADGAREKLGALEDKGRGEARYAEVRNYIFEDFLGEVAANPAASRLLGEERIDGVRYFILESRLDLASPARRILRKLWVSEEGLLLKAEIDDRTEDYEVYDSDGAAVTEPGHTRHLDLEVKNRVFM